MDQIGAAVSAGATRVVTRHTSPEGSRTTKVVTEYQDGFIRTELNTRGSNGHILREIFTKM